MSRTGASANGSQELVVELSHHRRRVHHPVGAACGQLQLKGARIVGVISAPQQAGVLQRTRELRDVHDLEASEVREFALARQCATSGELVKRGEQEVVGVRQAEPIKARSTATRHFVERCHRRYPTVCTRCGVMGITIHVYDNYVIMFPHAPGSWAGIYRSSALTLSLRSRSSGVTAVDSHHRLTWAGVISWSVAGCRTSICRRAAGPIASTHSHACSSRSPRAAASCSVSADSSGAAR